MFSRRSISNTQRERSNKGSISIPEFVATSEIARITETIEAGGVGRMHFRSTYWNARSIDGTTIEEGSIVHPIQRIGATTWYVVAEGRAPIYDVAA